MIKRFCSLCGGLVNLNAKTKRYECLICNSFCDINSKSIQVNVHKMIKNVDTDAIIEGLK